MKLSKQLHWGYDDGSTRHCLVPCDDLLNCVCNNQREAPKLTPNTMTNKELTMQVVRYCSLGEMPEIKTDFEAQQLNIGLKKATSLFDFVPELILNASFNTIKLHHPDKWREVIPKVEAKEVDYYGLISNLDIEPMYRPQWVNDLFYKYNIALDKDWEQHENIEFYEKD